MAYTRKFNKEQEEQPFPTRLRQLTEGKYSQSEIAKYVGCTPQAIGSYMRGETIPKITDAVKIADFLNVSLDYLSGRTDIISLDASIQGAHEMTGMSEKALLILSVLSSENKDFLSGFIAHLSGESLMNISIIAELLKEKRAIISGQRNFTPEYLQSKTEIMGLKAECQERFSAFIDEYTSEV